MAAGDEEESHLNLESLCQAGQHQVFQIMSIVSGKRGSPYFSVLEELAQALLSMVLCGIPMNWDHNVFYRRLAVFLSNVVVADGEKVLE